MEGLGEDVTANEVGEFFKQIGIIKVVQRLLLPPVLVILLVILFPNPVLLLFMPFVLSERLRVSLR